MSGIDALSKGVLGGAEVGGRREGLTAGLPAEDVWLGPVDIYQGFPTSAAPVELVVQSQGTNAANDAAEGTGCQQVEVYVLRSIASKAYERVVVEMTGATAVSLGDGYRAILCRGIRFGSAGSNQGNIEVRPQSATPGATSYCYMPVGENQSAECVYTVPGTLPIYLRCITLRTGILAGGGGGGTAVTVDLLAREFGTGGFRVLRRFDFSGQQNQNIVLPIPLILQPWTDIKMHVERVSDSNTAVECVLDFGP